jgi:hypothetical protein
MRATHRNEYHHKLPVNEPVDNGVSLPSVPSNNQLYDITRLRLYRVEHATKPKRHLPARLYDVVIQATIQIPTTASECVMRINARLDEEHSQKLVQLRKQNNLSVSDVVKQAIDLMYTLQKAEPKKKLKVLLASDFVGCGRGPKDLSTRYKTYLAEGLEEKHDSD